MRAAWVAIASLLFCLRAACNCSVVEVVETKPSSQNAILSVLLDSQPQKNVKVVVSTQEGKAVLTTATDSRGIVRLPDLPPGTYCVVASASPTLSADLCLAVSGRHSRKPSSFSMALTIKPPPPPTFEEQLAAAEKSAVEIHMQAFEGVVQDPSGAIVPQVQVSIYPHGLSDGGHAVRIASDYQGHFSAPLAPGTYTAVFQIASFQTKFFVFEIAPSGSTEELHVKLELGLCT